MPGPCSSEALNPLRRASARPALMGILNATPDSFSDGGACATPMVAVQRAQALVAAGADWLDIGGESTRPGAQPVSAADEWARVEPVLLALRQVLPDQALSIDTRRAEVAIKALGFGVAMVNDVSAGDDPEMLAVVAQHRVAMCLMHMQGTPATMQECPTYHSVVDDVFSFFEQRITAATAAGIALDRLILDPGIGFGKTLDHNRELLGALPRLRQAFDLPLLVGLSRKRLIPMWLGRDIPADQRDHLSHILHAQIAPHCDVLRVHDVAGAHDACRLVLAEGGQA